MGEHSSSLDFNWLVNQVSLQMRIALAKLAPDTQNCCICGIFHFEAILGGAPYMQKHLVVWKSW